MKRLNIMFILYNKKEFSLEIFLNGISIILGIVYILYVEYPIFVDRIKGNKIAIISFLFVLFLFIKRRFNARKDTKNCLVF